MSATRALGIAAATLTLLVTSAACGAVDPVQPAARSVPFAEGTSAPAAPPSSAVVAPTEVVAPMAVAAAALPAPVVRRAPATTRAAATSAATSAARSAARSAAEPVAKPKPKPEPAPKPVAQPVAKPAPASSSCNSNYTPCVPNDPKDVDCQGGSGNGPSYVTGPVRVTGTDVYGLDADKNGIGCE